MRRAKAHSDVQRARRLRQEQWHALEETIKDQVPPRKLRALTSDQIEQVARNIGPRFANTETSINASRAVTMTRDKLIRLREEAKQNAARKRSKLARLMRAELRQDFYYQQVPIANAGDVVDIKEFSDDGELVFFYVMDQDAIDDPFSVHSVNIDHVIHVI